MTPRQQRIAFALSQGWHGFIPDSIFGVPPNATSFHRMAAPDPANDYNIILKACAELEGQEQLKRVTTLIDILDRESNTGCGLDASDLLDPTDMTATLLAMSPAQHLESYLKVKELWVEVADEE